MVVLSIKWYSLENILKHKAQYYMIFGMRSNGKSYAVQKHMIDEFFEKGKEFIIIKRYAEDMKTKTCSTMLAHLEDYVLETYNHKIKFYQGKWLVYDEETAGRLVDCRTLGYALSVSESDRAKGSQFPKVGTILFEEFLSMSCRFLPDEINLFINLVSTIGRNRTDVKVFMLANAISKYSPYSSALNVKLHRLKAGQIITREYKDKKGFSTKFAIERSERVDIFDYEENKEKSVYNIFGNSGVGKMITSGNFETHKYNQVCENVTFPECKKFLPKSKKYVLFNKNDIVPIAIQYIDMYFRVYIKQSTNIIVGFKEINKKHINPNNTRFIINGDETIADITNIKNLMKYNSSKKVNKMLDTIVHSINQNNIVFVSDEAGEDVISSFRISGLNII